MSWIPEAELPNDIAKLREELRAALMESVRPIQSQSCSGMYTSSFSHQVQA
jgi:hypothetical protein